MGWLSAAIGAAGSLFGSSKTAGKEKRAYKRSRKDDLNDKKWQFHRLRGAAERGGFNPLTALGTTGTAGFGSIQGGNLAPPLASTQMLVEGFKGIGDVAQGLRDEHLSRKEHQLELQKIELDKKRGAAPAQLSRPKSIAAPRKEAIREQLGVPTGEGITKRPTGRPGLWSKGATPLIRPDGQPTIVPTKVADRLDLVAFDAMVVDDYSMMYGDEIGQGVATPQIPGAVIQNEGGVFEQRTAEERERIIADPMSIEPFFPKLTNRPMGPGSSNRRKQRQ